MNKQIQALADQAETWNADGDKCEVDMEKFAELIVRECGRVYIQNQQDGVMTLTEDLLYHLGIKK